MTLPISVNITTAVNASAIRREKRDGRDVIIVPSATLPDNVVMNGVMYPADEIAKGYKSLDRSPAPLNHPTINGKFVSAKDPVGLAIGWIGAWNENVRQENGKVYLDKVIDVEVANSTERGRRVLSAINEGKPIHTSTGLYCKATPVANQSYKMVASDMVFDHDAILLDHSGAATPDQGVGIFVNAAGAQEEISVFNSVYDQTERDLDWAIDNIVQAMDKRQKAPLYSRIKAALIDAFSSGQTETVSNKETEMSKEELDKLSGKVDALTESLANIGKIVGEAVADALKPLTEANAASEARAKAKEEEEKSELIKKVVKANILTEETAKATPIDTLKALTANNKTAPSAPRLNGAFGGNEDSGFTPPKAQA